MNIKIGRKEGWDFSANGFEIEDIGITKSQKSLFEQIFAFRNYGIAGKPIINFILVYKGTKELIATDFANTPVGTEIRTPNLPGVFSYYHSKKSAVPSLSDWTIVTKEPKGVVLQSNGIITSYTTIQSAIDNAQEGDIIKLEAKTYNESITIAKNHISIFGADKEKTVINNLTFTGKNNYVKEVFVSGDLTFLCTQNYEARNANQLRDSIVNGNVYIGTATTVNTHEVNIDGCLFIGVGKEFVFNGFTGEAIPWGTHWIRNSRIRDRIPGNETIWNPPGTYHLKIYSGTLNFVFCPTIRFTEVTYFGPAVLRIDQCYQVEIDGNMNFDYNGEDTMVFNLENSGFFYKWNNPLTIRYNTEFNLIHSFFFTTGTAISYNSTAFSRWHFVVQKVYGSTTSLGGTGLAMLHISHSIFHFPAPDGLGTDSNNVWSAFIDY